MKLKDLLPTLAKDMNIDLTANRKNDAIISFWVQDLEVFDLKEKYMNAEVVEIETYAGKNLEIYLDL